MYTHSKYVPSIFLDTMSTSFGAWLLSTMEREHVSQKQLADLVGVTPGHVSHLVTGRREPTKELIGKICHALHVPPEQGLRAAGAIPERSPEDEAVEEFKEIYNEMSPDERRAYMEIGRAMRKLAQDRKDEGRGRAGKPRPRFSGA